MSAASSVAFGATISPLIIGPIPPIRRIRSVIRATTPGHSSAVCIPGPGSAWHCPQ